MKQFSTLVFMLLLAFGIQAQTLVNRAWKVTTGSPTLTYDYLAGYRGSNYVILVGNTYSPGQAENYLVSKYSFTGQLLWQTEFNTADNKSDIGFDLYIKGNGVYVTGSSIDTSTTDSDILTLKLSLDSGTIQWDTIYTGAYGGRSVALGIVADNAGNAYVLGGEETGAFDSRMTVIKYDAYGQQQWTMHYDSTGNIDGAGAIALSDTTLTVTGFSGSAFGTWSFVTLTASANTGAIISMRLDANGNGGMQQLYSATGHSSNNLYLTGSTMNSPANEDIKIICYDTLLNEKWVKTWGSPDSLMDRPRKIAMDGTGNVLVLGESRKPGGGSDIVLLSYNPNNGNLLWQRRISATNPAHQCRPADMVGMPSGLGGPIYVTGSAYTQAGGYDFITASYDASGNLRWTRTINDTLSSDDQAGDIQYTGGGVVVSGTSTLGGNSKYVSVKYEEQEDSLGLGVITPKETLDRISYMDYVFEGTVIAKNSYLNSANNFIYTSNTVQISRIYKGELDCGTVEIITLGGTVDTLGLSLSHNLEFGVGETGIFLAEPTTRELSATDFYSETNSDKLFIPYGDEGFFKYYMDGINHMVTLPWGTWDSLPPIYNLLEHECGEPTICVGSLTSSDNDGGKKEGFPKYSRQEFERQMAVASERASKAVKGGSRGINAGTLTYTLQNQIITGTTTKYLEFDIALSDNISSGWFSNGVAHILYNASIFGDSVVTNNKIQVSRGTLISSTADYMDPIPGDYSPGVVAISIVSELEPLGLEELYPAPINAVHVKMQITNCNVPNASISMTNATAMQNVSLYAATPNPDLGDNLYGYDAIYNSSSFPMLECKPTITSFSPQQLNAGVEDILTIRGYLFGPIKGSGGISMKNSNDGGLTDVVLDDIDYVAWSDTMIQVKVPSETDTTHNGLNKRAGVGSGAVTVKTNAGDIGVSATPVTVGFSATNDMETFTGTPKKYLAMLADYGGISGGGYTFRIDTSVSNRPYMKSTVIKSVHDWVCLTTVHFEVGADTIVPASGALLDRVNLIHVGTIDDSASVLARGSQWFSICENANKVTVKELDISINRSFLNKFFIDTTGTLGVPSGMVDFYQIILHEIGHIHSLQHVNNPNSVMWWSSSQNGTPVNQRRIRLYTDATCYEGGGYVVQNSSPTGLGCHSTMTPIYTNECTAYNSIKKPVAVNNIKLYPNPTNEYLNVEYNISSRSAVQVVACNITGALIHSSGVSYEEEGTHIFAVPTSDWADGFYLINVKINGQNHAVKIIKN